MRGLSDMFFELPLKDTVNKKKVKIAKEMDDYNRMLYRMRTPGLELTEENVKKGE